MFDSTTNLITAWTLYQTVCASILHILTDSHMQNNGTGYTVTLHICVVVDNEDDDNSDDFCVYVGPINREMRNLISSLKNHNEQLKVEVQRYKRRLREAGAEITKVLQCHILLSCRTVLLL